MFLYFPLAGCPIPFHQVSDHMTLVRQLSVQHEINGIDHKQIAVTFQMKLGLQSLWVAVDKNELSIPVSKDIGY